MPSYDQTWKYSLTGSSAPADTAELTKTAGGVESVTFTVAGSTSNSQKAVAFPIANLQAVWIVVEGADGTVTLKTNSSGSPTDTKTFPAGAVSHLIWDNQSAFANPFSGAITTTYWTTAGAAQITVTVVALYTP